MDCLQAALQAQFTLLTDSLAQPGALLFRELVEQSIEDKVCLICAQSPSNRFRRQSVDIINVSAQLGTLDLNRILEEIKAVASKQVFIDSVALLSFLSSPHSVVHLIRSLLSDSIKVTALLSLDLCSDSTNILHILLTPSLLNASFCRLRLHHSSLLESLRSTYNIRVDTSGSDQHDLRIYDFLTRFSQRGWAGHGFRTANADSFELAATLDPLGQAVPGRSVLEWHVSDDLVRVGPRRLGDRSKTALAQRGLTGLAIDIQTKRPTLVALRTILAADPVVVKSSATTIPDMPSGLSFNLSLSEEQRQAKESVVLPYLPRADGTISSGRIDYEADSNDDIDEEEGDED